MSEYTARPRPEADESDNDLYHLYTDSETGDVLCRGYVTHHESESHTVSEAELEYSAYLNEDGDTVGRVCRNCRQIVLGTVFE